MRPGRVRQPSHARSRSYCRTRSAGRRVRSVQRAPRRSATKHRWADVRPPPTIASRSPASTSGEPPSTTSQACAAPGHSEAQSGSRGAAEGPRASTTRRATSDSPDAKTTRAKSLPRRSTLSTAPLVTQSRTPGYWSMRWSQKSRKSFVDGRRKLPRKPQPLPLGASQSQPSSPPASWVSLMDASRSTTSFSLPFLAANCWSAKES
mmetsp:Transcript_18656/g.55469  ORF Transcript_18656/g.55469 Transcript_18656/m.55469 type:complete len:206 (-) Transcript_18656:176-793(-)